MRNTLTFLITAVLTASAALAQQSSEKIEDIMAELMNYSEEQAPAAEEAALEKPAADAVVDTAAKVEKKTAAAVRPAEPPVAIEDTTPLADLDTWVEEKPAAIRNEEIVSLSDLAAPGDETSELVHGGDFANALQGLADLIKIAPENAAARLYLRTLMERDHRTAEIDGLEAVDAAWSTELVLRSYKLNDGAREKMRLEDVTTAIDVEALFPHLDFPKDSMAIYQPKNETIFVRNMPENLAILETMLGTMGVLKGSDDAEQVEIEAKFVEVAEGTLEELGFQWNFEDSTHIGAGGADLDVNDGSGGLFSEALRGSPNNSSAGSLPFTRQVDLGDGTLSASGDWSTFRFEDTFSSIPSDLTLKHTGGNAFDVLISALDQSSGADVLSAPRILTRSGEEATIRVGELHYFPEVFEGDSGQATIVNVSYDDFEEKLLGVELTVIPKVNDEREITLQLNPRINELTGWQSYQMAPANSIYNHRQGYARARYVHPALTASLPIFKRREIETEVTIADGSTIGMGGLISEKIETFEDKVPLLGSIPLVGRLFRNEGERAVKRNLLMFVTAKIVEPNGRIDTSRSFE